MLIADQSSQELAVRLASLCRLYATQMLSAALTDDEMKAINAELARRLAAAKA